MEAEFTPFMRQLEERFRAATHLTDRSQYKIYYGQVRPAWILTLAINPGGAPSQTNSDGRTHVSGISASASASFFENNEHDILDCEWQENPGLRRLLTPLLGGDLGRVRDEVVKTNLAFRRSAKVSQIKKEAAFDETAPFLNEIIGVVHPRLVLLTSPTLASFSDRYAKDVKMLSAPQKDESIGQTVFVACAATLRRTSSKALIVQVAHASQWSWTYERHDVASRISALIKA